MQAKGQIDKTPTRHRDFLTEVPFSSNSVRLTGKQWLIALGALILICLLTPILWSCLIPHHNERDYRISNAHSQDYWSYKHLCAFSAKMDNPIIVLGDSVMWGAYVSHKQTVTHFLNERLDSERFINLGINGSHPMALAGLIEYYGRDIRDLRVLLHYNPLWMSSPRHDLQIEKEFSFNHPRLVPQFRIQIPCYRANLTEKISAVMSRYIEFLSWIEHLRIVHFDSQDLANWSIEHPYQIPWSRKPAPANETSLHPARSWQARGMRPQNLDWVTIDSSLQWAAFQRTLDSLKKRGNQLLVLVGPFNEHCLQADSRREYLQLKEQIKQVLEEQDVTYLAPEALDSELYADASHPLANGYMALVQEISQQAVFKSWLERQ
jgi:hypothetical protein